MRKPLDVLRSYAPHDGTLGGLLASRTAADPERAFLLCSGRIWSYREFSARVARLAAALAERGVAAGDRQAPPAYL